MRADVRGVMGKLGLDSSVEDSESGEVGDAFDGTCSEAKDTGSALVDNSAIVMIEIEGQSDGWGKLQRVGRTHLVYRVVHIGKSDVGVTVNDELRPPMGCVCQGERETTRKRHILSFFCDTR